MAEGRCGNVMIYSCFGLRSALGMAFSGFVSRMYLCSIMYIGEDGSNADVDGFGYAIREDDEYLVAGFGKFPSTFVGRSFSWVLSFYLYRYAKDRKSVV